MGRALLGLALVAAFVGGAGGATAQDDAIDAARCEAFGDDDAEVGLRLREVRASLGRHEDDMRHWWSGWLAFHAVTTAVELVLLFTSPDDVSRVAEGISTGSAALGLVSLLLSTSPLLGAGGHLDALPERTPEERLRKLVEAESLLRRSADAVSEVRSPLSGLISVGYSLASSITIVAIGRPWSALLQAVGSSIVGPARILTYPWGIRDEWRRYRRAHADAGCTSALPTEVLSARLAPRWSVGVGTSLTFTLSF